MSIIDNFIKRYTKEYDYFFEASRLCAQQCDNALQRSGIRTIVSHRAKRPDSLYNKISKRNEEKKYRKIEDIYADIPDLAGVRIAIYFPGDREEVNKFIETNFEVTKKKSFPESSQPSYEKRFSGYWATHYRVYLKDEYLSENSKRYREAMVEIQVASVLMHAWSEVEHDLVYKPLSGKLSDEEYAILDELNGLVMAGEIAMERLQKAVKLRVGEQGKKFNNHYELAAFLYDSINAQSSKSIEPIMGRADILFRFLQNNDIDKPERLREFIQDIDPDTEKRPLVDQIVDRILSGNALLYESYNKARYEVSSMNPYNVKQMKFINKSQEPLLYFLYRWILLEKVIREIKLKRQIYPPNNPNIINKSTLVNLGIMDDKIAFEIDSLRRLRNQVVHGIEMPENHVLYTAGKYIESVLISISEKMEPEIRDLINSELQNIA